MGSAVGLDGRGRGQSTTLQYTLTLAVATLVVTGLFVAAGDLVTSEREQVVRTELEVVGQQLAGELSAADRLVRSSEGTQALAINVSLPPEVTGAGYTVAVSDDGTDQWINLTAASPDVSVSVRVDTGTDLADGSVQGGDLSIVYDGSALEVRS